MIYASILALIEVRSGDVALVLRTSAVRGSITTQNSTMTEVDYKIRFDVIVSGSPSFQCEHNIRDAGIYT